MSSANNAAGGAGAVPAASRKRRADDDDGGADDEEVEGRFVDGEVGLTSAGTRSLGVMQIEGESGSDDSDESSVYAEESSEDEEDDSEAARRAAEERKATRQPSAKRARLTKTASSDDDDRDSDAGFTVSKHCTVCKGGGMCSTRRAKKGLPARGKITPKMIAAASSRATDAATTNAAPKTPSLAAAAAFTGSGMKIGRKSRR